MDEQLRALGRAARAEVEAGLDIDAELAALDGRPSPASTAAAPPEPTRGRAAARWVAAIAAAAVALVGGVWLLGDDDAAIRTAEPATTLAGPATTPTSSVASTEATDPTTAPSTTATAPAACTNVEARAVGVAGLADVLVEARLAGRAPAVDGCLESIPAAFDGSPSACWGCAGQTIAVGARGVSDTASGFTFDLAVSTPTEGGEIVDVVEHWYFDVDDDLLVFADVELREPLVSRDDSLATIVAYLDAIESGAWLDAARMLDDGAQNAEERADLRRLDLDDYSPESIAAGLERWCASGCRTERPAATDLTFNGYTHDLVRFGERIFVRWFEGNLSIDGLPPRIPDAPTPESVDWRDLSWEGTGLAAGCGDGGSECVDLIHALEGTPISYDSSSRTLTRHGVPVVSAVLPESYGDEARLRHAGPDGVVYVEVAPLDAGASLPDLVELSLVDGDVGREIRRWDGVEYSSESELVATGEGLVRVECCGLDPIRPAPDATVVVPWVDRAGNETTAPGPWMRVVTEEGGSLTVAREDTPLSGVREWTFTPPADQIWRVMPPVTPTFDGGFVAALATAHAGGPATTIVRGWPNGDVEQTILAGVETVALDRSGRVLVPDGDRFARVEVVPDRTVRPAGQATVDVEAGTVTLPDLGEVTADWLVDPVAFGDAVRGPLAANEQRTIEAEQRTETEWLVTVTTSNFFDDSVFADRWELVLDQRDDGRFAFVSGTWSNACQPDRGHQDFRPDLCA